MLATKRWHDLRLLEEDHQFWNKSTYDYEYLLKRCLESGANWIMVVEDDVLAKEGSYTQSRHALEDIQMRMQERGWLYLRLFSTEKLLGWNSEEWLQYLGWSMLAFLVTAIALIVGRCHPRRLRKQLSNALIAVICCFCLPAAILHVLYGRSSFYAASTFRAV